MGVLEEISISHAATYTGDPQQIAGLRKINFFFGSNGSGKTTISRIIADPATYTTCSVKWRNNHQLETFVYNRDFVQDNFSRQLRGIFTLGEKSSDFEEELAETKGKIDELTQEMTRLESTLGKVGSDTGKYGELAALQKLVEEQCWGIKTRFDEYFQSAFQGYRGTRSKFTEKILEENAANQAQLHPFGELTTRAQTVFAKDASPLQTFPTLDITKLAIVENTAVLSKKIIGKESVDIGALILKLGNSDWIRHGLQYTGKAGDPCPFCQKPLDSEFLSKINDFFDEAYLADIAAIKKAQSDYDLHSREIIAILENALTLDCPFVAADTLRSTLDQLISLIGLNKNLLERKIAEPSVSIDLKSASDILNKTDTLFTETNKKIAEHNELLSRISDERKTLISEIWKYLIEENKQIIDSYLRKKNDLDKAIAKLNSTIETKRTELKETQQKQAKLEYQVTSVKPTVIAINNILESFGFNSFKLATAGEKGQFYQLIRSNGSEADGTLSEGERSFVTFLYFYHLLQGSISSSGVNTNRIVVFDDPISSLDSEVLFIVSTLIKKIITKVKENQGNVKQVFVLTHNVYFHKEVSLNTKRNKNSCLADETFWIVRKTNHYSIVENYQFNPIKSSYELLWAEVRKPGGSPLTIQNVLRRILEYYFTILGGMEKDKICEKFNGKDQQICNALFSWINDGSHNFADDIYVTIDQQGVERYLLVFKQIFVKTEHTAHYAMMMGLDNAALNEPIQSEPPTPVLQVEQSTVENNTSDNLHFGNQ